jgi:hypothetical protein
MNSKLFAVLCAAGAMIPACGQNISLERTSGDGPVHPNQAVCILATMAHPDDEVSYGNFTAKNKGPNFVYTVGAVVTRPSPTSVKLCGSLNASAPSGSYDIVAVDLRSRAGKASQSTYPTNFHQMVSFEFINEAEDVPTVVDVKRVPAQ